MKKLLILNWALLAVMLFFAISACESKDGDDDIDPNSNSSGYFLKAKVDGVLVEFKQEDLQLVNIGATLPGVY